MNKTWLIRTKNNHILGPVSRDKILTLLENKTLNLEDELCSGNGYWFSVKEEDLVQKYIHNQIIQSYNPISEAPTVLCVKELEDDSQMTPPIDHVTQVRSLVDLLGQNEKDPLIIELLDPNEPPSVKLPIKTPEIKKEDSIDLSELTSSSNHNFSNFSTTELKKVKALNSSILYTLAIVFLLIAIVGFYFRKTLLENFLA